MFRNRYIYFIVLLLSCLSSGCGTTKSRSATEQLLLSDAVDRSVASINFRPLAGRSVYLDTQYVKSVKGLGFVNADYIISSLRQQMLAANCYLEEERDEAEYIAEVRVGALGADSHDVTYGIPASSSLSSAAALVPNAPPIPMIPEISVAKKADEMAVAKIAVFAYHCETRQAVWQSGLAQARSSSKDMWLFGAGPFQSGTIHDGTQFAGENLDIPLVASGSEDDLLNRLELYAGDHRFELPPSPKKEPEKPPAPVQPASHQEESAKPEPPAESAANPADASAPPAAG